MSDLGTVAEFSFQVSPWPHKKLGWVTGPGLYPSLLQSWGKSISQDALKLKQGLWNVLGWKILKKTTGSILSTKIHNFWWERHSQISSQSVLHSHIRQPKEVENKKHMLHIFVPVIKHLLEQAESKCTADKENITMSQNPDSFWYIFQWKRASSGCWHAPTEKFFPALWQNKQTKKKVKKREYTQEVKNGQARFYRFTTCVQNRARFCFFLLIVFWALPKGFWTKDPWISESSSFSHISWGLQLLIVVVSPPCFPFFAFNLKKALNPLRTEGA